MINYYQQKFVLADPLFAEVKEDLRSYFESGALDDMMFPLWTEQALRKFRRSSYKMQQTVLHLKDYESCLPEDFKYIREAWMCTTEYTPPIWDPTAFYYQRDCRIEDYKESGCSPCFGEDEDCSLQYKVTHKVTNQVVFSFTTTFLLTPGNVRAKQYCGENCPNLHIHNPYTYDIYDNKIITNFESGTIYLVYYSDSFNENGERLVPDNFYVQEFIKSYIKYKCFSQLSNQVTDETFNQIQLKKQEADREQAEAYILAETDLKKKTVEQKVKSIGKTYRRNNKYNIR